MFKAVILVHRRPGLSREDFSRYWRDDHAPVGSTLPGLRRYVQNHASTTPDGSAAPYDGFVEVWFDNQEAFEKAMSSPETEIVNTDVANFVDVDRMQPFFVEEVVVV
jgi:uncharacterized protein (TIGR02118 family)